MKNFSKKVWLDVVLFITMIYLMCYRYVPRLPHEILGTLIIFALILHVYWNRRAFRIKSLETILLVIFILTIISGICLSHELFRELIGGAFRKNVLVHKLHAAMPYYGMILTGIHLGMNLRFRIPLQFGILLILAGIWGSLENSLLPHLIFQRVKHAERFPEFTPEIFLSIVSIFLASIVIGYFYKHRRQIFKRA